MRRSLTSVLYSERRIREYSLRIGSPGKSRISEPIESGMKEQVIPAKRNENVNTRVQARRELFSRTDRVAYSFLLPFAILFVAFSLYPFFVGLYLSFTDNSPLAKETHFIGFANYVQVLINDRIFVDSLKNTFYYVIIVVPAQVALGLVFALYINKQLFGHQISRMAFFAPFVLSVSVVGIVWGWMLETRYGLLNLSLAAIGLPGNTPWLSNISWVMVGIGLSSLWWHIGISMVLFLAGLQDIPAELREAAVIDGANSWQVFWNVTLPLLRPVGVLVFILALIDAMKVFGQPWFMTNGGPAGASTTVVYDLYLNFQSTKMGYASAIGFLLLVIILIIALIRQFALKEELT